MRLDLAVYDREVTRNREHVSKSVERSLYRHFYNSAEEATVAEFLLRQYQPMNREEAHYFGLAKDSAPDDFESGAAV